MVVISVYTYGVKIIKKFRWESGFLGGSMDGSAGYLMQLSVKQLFQLHKRLTKWRQRFVKKWFLKTQSTTYLAVI